MIKDLSVCFLSFWWDAAVHDLGGGCGLVIGLTNSVVGRAEENGAATELIRILCSHLDGCLLDEKLAETVADENSALRLRSKLICSPLQPAGKMAEMSNIAVAFQRTIVTVYHHSGSMNVVRQTVSQPAICGYGSCGRRGRTFELPSRAPESCVVD